MFACLNNYLRIKQEKYVLVFQREIGQATSLALDGGGHNGNT